MIGQNNSNLYDVFRSAFPADMDTPLLQSADGELYSYANVVQDSARLANYLLALGGRPGDRVTVQVEKSPDVLCLYLACLRAGLVYHPLNMAYRHSELAYFLSDAQPRIVVCSAPAKPLFDTLAGQAGVEHVLSLNDDHTGSLIDAAAGYSDSFDTVVVHDNDLAALLYSSGTTGQPKGIMLSHGNLASNGKTLVKLWGFEPDDRLLHALPIFHVHGLFVAIHCVLLSGSRMCWLPSFDARKVTGVLPQCSVMMGVPTYYTRLLDDVKFNRACCVNMRLFISGSAPLLTDTFEAFHARSGHAIIERYGMSETGMNTSNPLGGERRAGTVGPALPDVDLRIVNAQGESCAPGIAGGLWVRGPNVFQGYWNMPEKTRESFDAEGFFDTGDIASMSADGYVSIVGRSKDMIICGGLNVYPKEIELLLDELDGVQESAIIGVPHRDFGEVVVAVIVRSTAYTLDEAELVDFCKTRIANFKVPKRVFAIDELPRNAMGKVQKNLLRERYADCCLS